jgi:hypothetical protein
VLAGILHSIIKTLNLFDKTERLFYNIVALSPFRQMGACV